jgi:hypothetical protein
MLSTRHVGANTNEDRVFSSISHITYTRNLSEEERYIGPVDDRSGEEADGWQAFDGVCDEGGD